MAYPPMSMVPDSGVAVTGYGTEVLTRFPAIDLPMAARG